MKKLIFATNNPNKLKEVKALLPGYEVLGLQDIGCTEEIPETADTLEGNALMKAQYVVQNYGYDCFADDTGLEVLALNGEPGVYSARYAGEEKSAMANMQKLLSELKGKSNRQAKFRTVVALMENGKETLFEGSVEGKITEEMTGTDGFGYDPIFLPDERNCTFAELSLEEKNKISHRARAVQKLINYLNSKG